MKKRLFSIVGPCVDSPTRFIVELPFAEDRAHTEQLIHDLRASVQAIRITLNDLAANSDTASPRETRKQAQLKSHVERIESAIESLCLLLNGKGSRE
ncbi:MAG: hypothetical protein NTV34_16475 [Proteobacteria bacterium]|nr:hypothetical protein [Pseudomonadota bacterium]